VAVGGSQSGRRVRLNGAFAISACGKAPAGPLSVPARGAALRSRLVGCSVAPERVADAGKFASQRDDSDASSTTSRDLRRPELERTRCRRATADLKRPSSLGEHPAYVRRPSLGDAQALLMVRARALPWRQAEIRTD